MRDRFVSALPITLFAAFLLLAAAPLSVAQIRGAGVPAWRGPASGMGHGFGVAVSRTPDLQRLHRPAVYLGSPYFYSDYPFAPVVQQAPPQVVLQPPAEPEHVKEAGIEPLMIEWQGDHYASVSAARGAAATTNHSSQDKAGAPAETTSAAAAKRRDRTKSAPGKAPLPPVVLVYRDGHHEKIHDYTIVGGTIYARGDYWTDGYWTRKIQLAALDLPATAKASQADGAKFVLPSSPDEVVTRP